VKANCNSNSSELSDCGYDIWHTLQACIPTEDEIGGPDVGVLMRRQPIGPTIDMCAVKKGMRTDSSIV